MKKWLFLLLFTVVLLSCKSKALLVESKVTSSDTINKKVLTSEEIIQNHYNTKTDFSTLYIRSSAKYKDEKQSQNVTAEIKIKKGEKILISIRFLGVTMAKALITPDQVQYYEKLNSTYFEGDYQSLSQWIGTDLDFNTIQNMLIGQPIEDMTKANYILVLIDSIYKLNRNDQSIEKSFSFDLEKYALKKQEIVQLEKQRMVEVNYANFNNFTSLLLPSNVYIKAMQKKGKTEINIEYNAITLNEELTFPYSVPSGYDRKFIN